MKIFHRHLASIFGIALAMTLTACAESESGTPTPSTPDDTFPSATSTEAGSSRSIQDPINTTRLLDQPCTVLADEDLAALNLSDGELDTDTASSAAAACVWKRSEDSGSRTDFMVMTENDNGLEAIRQQNEQSELFEETRIGEYPALHASVLDNRDDGDCNLWIGANASQVLFIYVSLNDVPAADEPCGYADKVGEAAIANLTS